VPVRSLYRLWAIANSQSMAAGVAITALLMLRSFARIALVFKILCAALLFYVVVMVIVTHNWSSVDPPTPTRWCGFD
jgi:hypothetical protein